MIPQEEKTSPESLIEQAHRAAPFSEDCYLLVALAAKVREQALELVHADQALELERDSVNRLASLQGELQLERIRRGAGTINLTIINPSVEDVKNEPGHTHIRWT